MKYKELQMPIFIFIFLAILFIGIIIFYSTKVDKSLKIDNEINLYVTKINKYKGVMLLNDSIVISENCPKININESVPKSTIEIIKDPFQIIKKAHNDTLKIIQYNDTLYFKYIDPSLSDSKDPTIKEFIKSLWNE